MRSENTLTAELKIIKELVFNSFGLEITNLKLDSESVKYAACSFNINEKRIEYRVSKITPTKIGQFVSIWKRSSDGITEPFDVKDELDFIIITSKSGDRIGQFIFPKLVLVEKGIISQNGKGGKRGIRVYPPWDMANNRQAIKTQNWQLDHFYEVCENTDIKRFFSQ